MSRAVPDILLEPAAAAIDRELGLHFPPPRWSDLERGLQAAADELQSGNLGALVRALSTGRPSRGDLDVLASHLTVGETYFFRDPALYAALEQRVIPERLRLAPPGERRLRFWSAGCCSGEEPYSIALLLEQMAPDKNGWEATVLATDINPAFLRKAHTATYKTWSFRGAPPGLKERHFTKDRSGQFVLHERIRRRVAFDYLNLNDESYPSLLNGTNALDVILCRNVLMYFSPARQAEVIARLHRALAPGGFLVVSASEVSQQLFAAFEAVRLEGIVLYRRSEGARPASRVADSSRPAIVAPGRGAPAPRPRKTVAASKPPARAPRHRVPPAPTNGAETLDAQLSHAASLSARGLYAEADAAVGGALSREPRHAGALALRARIAANRGDLTAALAWCDEAISADRLDPLSYHLRASILDELGRAIEARDALRTALYLAPDFVLGHFTLGHLALREARAADARKYFANVLSLLEAMSPEAPLPGAEGLTVGRVAEIARSLAKTAA